MNSIFNSTKLSIRGFPPKFFADMVKENDFDSVKTGAIRLKKSSSRKFYKTIIEADDDKKIYKIEKSDGRKHLIVSDCVTKSAPCWFCRERKGIPDEGYPIDSYKIKEKIKNVTLVFPSRGYFCDILCCYWYCLDQQKIPEKRALFTQVLGRLDILYDMMTDGDDMPGYRNWSLLRHNGGSLEYEQWKCPDFEYKQMPGYMREHAIYTYEKL